jgi:hypothetical protein
MWRARPIGAVVAAMACTRSALRALSVVDITSSSDLAISVAVRPGKLDPWTTPVSAVIDCLYGFELYAVRALEARAGFEPAYTDLQSAG